MVKLFSIFMSALILVQSVDITTSDIAQFDELMEHAAFHAEKYGDNLFVFISKHYGELKEAHNEDHQEERKDHEKLPFQNHCNCTSITAIVSTPEFFDLGSVPLSESLSTDFYYHLPTSSLHKKGLFQPPRTT